MDIVNGIYAAENHAAETTAAVSFDALFNEYFDRLVYFSRQVVNDKEQARDIVQDAYVKYWHQRNAIIPNKIAAKNFLYTSVYNASLNAVRHTKIVENFACLHSATQPEPPPVIDKIITAEVVANVHLALQSLPAKYREVSVLSYFEGKKNHQIAEELEMSVNTVKKQKQKALQLLRVKLSPELLVLAFAVAVSAKY